MHSILIPVDGSSHALRAVRHAIGNIQEGLEANIHVLNVQPPMTMLSEFPFQDYALIEKAQQQHAEKVLKFATKLLDAAELSYTKHFEIGPVSRTIIDYAKANKCDSITMGTRGMGVFGNLVLGSTANQVIHLAEIPVTLVK
jgi:nucleotide-binding universal stress UspA family protein